MRSHSFLAVALAFTALPLPTAAQRPMTPDEVINNIVAQEHVEMQVLRQYSPLVETYIQYVRSDKQSGEVPDGDKYFLGRAALGNALELEPLSRDAGMKHKIFPGWGEFFGTEFLPRGFLQMIYLDMGGFDRQHYKFEYAGREFLGEVRCLVFDVNPLPRAGKGRFVGRIWVEDQAYHIVRFNGAYGGASLTSNYFNFESWRINAGKNLWLPAYIYCEGPSIYDAKARNMGFRPFKAQTRLWGYDLGDLRSQQELNKVLVESAIPVTDSSDANNDYSPLQAERSWALQAEDNVTDRLERQGLLAPSGEVEKVLRIVVDNLEVSNNLDVQPEVRCRVLMISTFESFTIGHTIVLSRGLIDVLPDEATLAVILAHELGHVLLRHRANNQFAFFSRVQFDEKGVFRHFDFARTAEEEQAANQKGLELIKNSPYCEQSVTAQLFLQALKDRSREIPNLLSPHLGGRLESNWLSATPPEHPSDAQPAKNSAVALPLGARIKVDPWNAQLTLLKAKPVGPVADDEKKPFQITPFAFYLTRQAANTAADATHVPAPKLDLSPQP